MNDTSFDTRPQAVVIQLQPEDLALAQRLHFWQHVRSRSGMIRLAILGVVATGGFATFMWQAGSGSEAVLPILAFGLSTPFAILAFPYLITHFLGGYVARKTFRQQKTLHKPFKLAWTEQAVLLQSDYGEARVPWVDFRKVREDRQMILLYESDRLHRVIPKRCLSAEQLADLQACMVMVPSA